jgi:hypothetical protein
MQGCLLDGFVQNNPMNSRQILGCFALFVLMTFGVIGQSAPSLANDSLRSKITLDGQWSIVPDKDNIGRRQGWYQPAVLAKQVATPIRVPSCWEATLKDYEGVVWYAFKFTLPAEWQDRHVRLGFDAVNYLSEVWINGRPVGDHEGGYTPFSFDISERVDFGKENILVVRVVGPAIKAESVDILLRDEVPHWRGAYLGGIWQSVWMQALAPVHVRDVFVKPVLALQQALLQVELENAGYRSVDLELQSEIVPAAQLGSAVAKETTKVNVPPGGVRQVVGIKIPNPKLWSPEQPELYLARIKIVVNEKLLDQFEVRFGMREFTVREGNFFLNGERIFLKGAFWEGFYPGTQAHPRDPEIVRQEIRMAKEAGLNLLRPWRMPPVPMIPELADEMGILLIGSPPIENMGYWPAETPQLERRWTREMEQLVLRDRNHASIICWETANEIIRKSELLPRHPVSLAARRLDPTRLIIDESGGSRAPWGANAYLPYSTERFPIRDHHIYRRAPVNKTDYEELATAGDTNLLTFISEVGYGGWPDLPQNVERYKKEGNPLTADYRFHQELLASLEKVFQSNRLNEVFPDISALCRASQQIQAIGNRLQLEAVRMNPAADGYCLHAFTDGDWVFGAGVLDLWRQPKALYQSLKEVQQPLCVAIRTDAVNAYAARGLAIEIQACNDQKAFTGELVLEAMGNNHEVVWQTRQKVFVSRGISRLFQDKLGTASWQGKYTLRVQLLREGQQATENAQDIFVLAATDVLLPVVDLSLVDTREQLKPFLQSAGREWRSFDGTGSGVALVVDNDAQIAQQVETFVRLMDWVKRGGVAIWLKPPSRMLVEGDPIYRDYENNYMMQLRQKRKPKGVLRNSLLETKLFPWALQHRNARGMWIPVGHFLRKHAVFEGLPQGGFLDQLYQNIAPASALMEVAGEELAGCVAWSAEPHDYYPKLEAWHAVDLATVPHGKGTMILSTFQILEHLGKDPLADKLLVNLLKHATKLRKELEPVAPDFPQEILKYQKDFSEVWKNMNLVKQ